MFKCPADLMDSRVVDIRRMVNQIGVLSGCIANNAMIRFIYVFLNSPSNFAVEVAEDGCSARAVGSGKLAIGKDGLHLAGSPRIH